MFGRQSTLGSSTTANSGNLVEFRAGRMNMIGKMVHPDPRKGLVYINQSDDGLMHFCWKDRTTGKVEDDLIVFPDDFEFKRVDQCKTGRVFVLKFKSSSRRMFFWMQEPKLEKDEEYCRRVNELMNNPPSATRNTNETGDLQYMLNNMSQQQLMQLFGGVGQMGGLSNLLGSMGRNADAAGRSTRGNNERSAGLLTSEASGGTSTRTTRSKSNNRNGNTAANAGNASNAIPALTDESSTRSLSVDLSTAITGNEAINQLIADPERAKTLSVHLPETEDGDENKKQQIKDTIASPQFQQALSLFSTALQSAQLGPVVSQFELTPDAVAAAYSGNLEDFVKALQKSLPEGTSMGIEVDEDVVMKDATEASKDKQESKDKDEKKN